MREDLINLNLIPISDGIWVVERLAARALTKGTRAVPANLEAGIDQPGWPKKNLQG